MVRYIVRRILWLIVIVVCVAVLIFTIMYFVPGDPVRLMLGDSASEEEVQHMRDMYGLNDPYIVQLGNFLYNVFFKFDFGTSITMKINVAEEIGARLPRTMALAWISLIIDLLIGIPLGINAAMHRGTWRDQGLMVFSMIGVSIPGFWLALLLVMLFSLKLGWLPPFGIGGIKYWIMPIIASSVAGICQTARQTRSAVLETMRADYITTARAKGVAENSVIYKHMLPNSMIPIINQLSRRLSGNIGGAVVIESVFSFPGIGMLMVNAISARDYPVVRACVLILAIFSSIVMMIVDVVYAYIDPRIKAQYASLAAKKKGGNGREKSRRANA